MTQQEPANTSATPKHPRNRRPCARSFCGHKQSSNYRHHFCSCLSTHCISCSSFASQRLLAEPLSCALSFPDTQHLQMGSNSSGLAMQLPPALLAVSYPFSCMQTSVVSDVHVSPTDSANTSPMQPAVPATAAAMDAAPALRQVRQAVVVVARGVHETLYSFSFSPPTGNEMPWQAPGGTTYCDPASLSS